QVLSPLQRAKLRATPRQVTSLAAETVRVAYELARSAAVWRSSPVQRRLRDAARQSHWDSDGAVNWDLPNSAMVLDERTLLGRAALENSPLSRFGARVWQLFR